MAEAFVHARRATVFFLVAAAVIFAANLASADPLAARKALIGGAIVAAVLTPYMAIRRRIKDKIGNLYK